MINLLTSFHPSCCSQAFAITGASNTIVSVGYVCDAACQAAAPASAPSKTPLIVGLVVGLGGGAILIGAVLLVVLLRRRSIGKGKGKVSKVSDFPASADGPDDASETPVSEMKTMPSPQPKASVRMVSESPAAPGGPVASNVQLHATPPSLVL